MVAIKNKLSGVILAVILQLGTSMDFHQGGASLAVSFNVNRELLRIDQSPPEFL